MNKLTKIKKIKYTAVIPKTIKATRNASFTFIKKIDHFLKNTSRKLKKIPKNLNKATAKSIRSLTKTRGSN